MKKHKKRRRIPLSIKEDRARLCKSSRLCPDWSVMVAEKMGSKMLKTRNAPIHKNGAHRHQLYHCSMKARLKKYGKLPLLRISSEKVSKHVVDFREFETFVIHSFGRRDCHQEKEEKEGQVVAMKSTDERRKSWKVENMEMVEDDGEGEEEGKGEDEGEEEECAFYSWQLCSQTPT